MLEKIGSHWMHPDRLLHGRRSASIELLYFRGAGAAFDMNGARARVRMALDKGCDFWLRIDYQPGQTLPPTGHESALGEFRQWAASVAADPVLGRSRGLICGNETNLSAEWRETNIPLTPEWVARCVYGFGTDTDDTGNLLAQHTFEWCVGASVQMAWNLVRDDRRGSFRDQRRLWEMARDRSTNAFGGANPFGWASVLTEIGLGEYEVVSIPNYERALRRAASALRETNRPVGLVMWRGRHAWVMSGFESRGDPARTRDFTLTGIRVLDPLFPHGSSLWGPSPPPNALVTPKELATDFVIRDRRNWSMNVRPGYLLVLPT